MAGKDVVGARAWVAAGRWHPALFTDSALAGAPHWVAGVLPPALAAGRPLHCHFMARRAPGSCECTCFWLWWAGWLAGCLPWRRPELSHTLFASLRSLCNHMPLRSISMLVEQCVGCYHAWEQLLICA